MSDDDKLPYVNIPQKIILGNSNYSPKYCQALVNHMAGGKSFESFAVSKGMTATMMRTMFEKFPEFKEAYLVAKEASMAAWEDIAMGQATGTIQKGSSSTLQFIMKNRFAEIYKDKQEIETNTNVVFRIETGFAVPAQALPDTGKIVDAEIVDDDSDLV